MIQAKSLHIGLNFVDPNHYGGWDGKLNSCERDANDMQSIASSQGFATTKILREEATRKNVLDYLAKASKEMRSGDILHISYAGHGGQVPDTSGEEVDGMDETWCLFDGQLLDDELKACWTKFQKGVRIFVVSDSCHSGTITRKNKPFMGTIYNPNPDHDTYAVPRTIPSEMALTTYEDNKSFYQALGRSAKKNGFGIKATVLLISACQDNQVAMGGLFNGRFTAALKNIWNGGNFRGSYHRFYKQIVQLLPPEQTPNLLTIGQENTNFVMKQRPFEL